MSSPKRALGRAVKLAAATFDRVRPPTAGIVVLLYHRVGRRSASEVDLDAVVFAEQMAYLAESAEVLRLGDAVERLTGAAPVGSAVESAGRPSVVVTFDDGTDDFVEVAVPILLQYGVPVTMFLATEFVDEGIAWPDGACPASWSALGGACATGLVDIGSHTHRHRLLDRLPISELDDELDRSIKLIEDRLDRTPTDFAYPKAVFGSPAADAAIRSRFRSAAVAGTHANLAGHTDAYRLARSPIQVGDGMTYFRHKAAGGMGFEDTLRRTANRARYAGKRS